MSEELTEQEIVRINDSANIINLHGKINGLTAQVQRLETAIQSALEVLGTGECKVNTCEGCQYETKLAIKDLQAALTTPSAEEKTETPLIATPFPVGPIPKPKPMTEEERKSVDELVRSPEFKAAMKEGLEDIKAGRVRPWPEIAKELGIPIPQQPATEAVCPCVVAIDNLDGALCIPCWEACYGRRRHIHCTTPGCVDGKIQVKESTDG